MATYLEDIKNEMNHLNEEGKLAIVQDLARNIRDNAIEITKNYTTNTQKIEKTQVNQRPPVIDAGDIKGAIEDSRRDTINVPNAGDNLYYSENEDTVAKGQPPVQPDGFYRNVKNTTIDNNVQTQEPVREQTQEQAQER